MQNARMKSTLALALGVLIGVALAAGFFLRVRVEPQAPEGREKVTTEHVAQPEVPRATEARAEEPSERVDASQPTKGIGTGDDELFSPALQRYARDGITASWKRVRAQPIPDATLERGWKQFREEVLALPERIGEELAKEANDADALAAALAGADAFELLTQLKTRDVGPFDELVGDAERFERLFVCTASAGPLVDGSQLSTLNELQDGTELRFPAGVHRFGLRNITQQSFPRCLSVRGAGMNRTLLLWETLHARQRIERIEISDATLSADYLFDLRTQLATIVLERVRIVGFDAGAGSSCVFATNGNALVVRDSRIEGGYGRNPGSGTLFDIRTPALLARFDRCTLSGLAIPQSWLRSGSTVLFSQCSFVDVTEPEATFAPPHRGLRFERCTQTYAARDENGWQQVPRLDLNDLFPGWAERR